MMENEFEGLPQKRTEPLEMRFFSTDDQKTLLRDQMRVQGSDLNGLAKLMSRIPGSKLQRSLAFPDIDDKDSLGVDESKQFATPTPLSPGEFT